MRRLVVLSLAALALLAAATSCGGDPAEETGALRFGFDQQRLTELQITSIRITIGDSNATPVDCERILDDPNTHINAMQKLAQSRFDIKDLFAESKTQEMADIPAGQVAIAVTGYAESAQNQNDDNIKAVGCNLGVIEGGKRTIIPVRLFDRS